MVQLNRCDGIRQLNILEEIGQLNSWEGIVRTAKLTRRDWPAKQMDEISPPNRWEGIGQLNILEEIGQLNRWEGIVKLNRREGIGLPNR